MDVICSESKYDVYSNMTFSSFTAFFCCFNPFLWKITNITLSHKQKTLVLLKGHNRQHSGQMSKTIQN